MYYLYFLPPGKNHRQVNDGKHHLPSRQRDIPVFKYKLRMIIPNYLGTIED